MTCVEANKGEMGSATDGHSMGTTSKNGLTLAEDKMRLGCFAALAASGIVLSLVTLGCDDVDLGGDPADGGMGGSAAATPAMGGAGGSSVIDPKDNLPGAGGVDAGRSEASAGGAGHAGATSVGGAGGVGTGGTAGGGGAGGTSPTCGLTSTEPACAQCMNSDCFDSCHDCSGSTDCVDLLGCIKACPADQSSCTESCLSSHSDGSNYLDKLLSCLQSECPTQCKMGSGAGGAGGGSGGSCGIGFSLPSCDKCAGAKCVTQCNACAGESQCVGIIDCLNACPVDDSTCDKQCMTEHASGTAAYDEFMDCVSVGCHDECTTGSGTGGSGGGGQGLCTGTCPTCEVVAKLDSASVGTGLAVDGEFVYYGKTYGSTGYSYSHEIYKQAKSGTGSQVLDSQAGYVDRMAVDATHLYWGISSDSSQKAAIRRTPIKGTDLDGETLALGSGSQPLTVYALGLSPTHVWWNIHGGIGVLPKEGGAAAEYPAPLGGEVYAMAVNGDEAYVYNSDNSGKAAFLRFSRATGNYDEILYGEYAQEVAVDNSNIYWMTSDSIKMMPRGSVSAIPTILATISGIADRMVVDKTHVYWSQNHEMVVLRVPIAGGSVEAVASGTVCPVELALDDDYVYFINNDWHAEGRTVARVHK